MAQATVVTPYSTAIPFITQALPSWVSSEYESQRLASYDLYDDMYDNVLGQFKVLLRGTDDTPILVPTAKRIVNTMARYVGRDWGYSCRPGVDPLTETQVKDDPNVTVAMTAFGELFNREGILSTFKMGKKEWMRRGDWCWYILADPLKPEGSRISVKTIDPRTYFPIIENDVVIDGDFDRVVGQTIAEDILGEDGKTHFIKRQRWLKAGHPEHPQFGQAAPEEGFDIYRDSVRMELKGWDSDDPKKQKIVEIYTPLEPLPGIKSLPVYHIKNNPQTGNPYGRSDFSGLETIFAAITQTISDEDIAIAMAGLGMWWTDAGAPLDENNQPTNWIIGPQRVAEVPTGSKFGRLSGITSIEPSQGHTQYLEEIAYGSLGINDIALGKNGSQPEAGVALAIKMQPLFDAADEKNEIIDDVMNHMFYDLKTWFLVYEGINMGTVEIVSVSSSERLPFDRDAFYKELTDGYLNGWFSVEYVWKQLTERLGYEIDIVELKKELDAAQKSAAAALDPYAERANDDLNGDNNEDDDADAEA